MSGDPPFIPGLALSEAFYREIVRPILAAAFPTLRYSAALIGSGSEVLGFDTPMSRDHHWGPRVMLFLGEDDHRAQREAIHKRLGERLPGSYRGYSTHFPTPDLTDNGGRRRVPSGGGPINHRVECLTIAGFCDEYLGLDVARDIDVFDWLTLPQQKLRSITGGGLFRDDVGLGALRQRLGWYPRDVWLYLLASLWRRIGQEEHLVGRAASVDDRVGSWLIAARLARDLMRLAFLMERVYAPYPKWFGSAFEQLGVAKQLGPALERVMRARSWPRRERALRQAYTVVAQQHRALELTAALPVRTARFWDRPFYVIGGDVYADALTEAITDPALASLARTNPIGSLDVFSDSPDLSIDAAQRLRLRELYRSDAAGVQPASDGSVVSSVARYPVAAPNDGGSSASNRPPSRLPPGDVSAA